MVSCMVRFFGLWGLIANGLSFGQMLLISWRFGRGYVRLEGDLETLMICYDNGEQGVWRMCSVAIPFYKIVE